MVETSISSIDSVGKDTIAVSLEAPPAFDGAPGQFVLVRAPIDEESAESYYTLSSPDVADSFEITVAVSPDATVGSWLAGREPGDTVTVEGPLGNVAYRGGSDVLVLAGGPGIGPAVGIGERAIDDHEVTIVYRDDVFAHRDRLSALEAAGATVTYLDGDDDIDPALLTDAVDASVFVFGFERFVADATDAIEAAGGDPSTASVEGFGPE